MSRKDRLISESSFDGNVDDRLKSIEAFAGFRNCSLSELESKRAGLSSQISHLTQKISDLAFNNYRIYADAGRTAENCSDMLDNINKEMSHVKERLPVLIEETEAFIESSEDIFREFMHLDDAISDESPIWEIVNLPKMMDKCIRHGQYDLAYALTTFAVNLQQSKLGENQIIKKVSHTLIEARHGLLDVLFNKFAGPIDLAKSIQIVNNIRKIPYISNTQLRVCLLQYRDVYLEKNAMALMSEPDYAIKIVDVYRDCMYDTIVLYLAVFPGVDSHKKYSSSDDPRWERWTGGSQNYLLQSWAHRNIDVMFERIRSTDRRSPIDLESIGGKLMSFANSFGRMGMDFRPLIINELALMTLESFSRRVQKATEIFIGQKQLDLLDEDIFKVNRNDIEGKTASAEAQSSTAPVEICVWDDLCVYGNEIIDALNDLRHSLSPVYINDVFNVLKSSLHAVLEWIQRFGDPADESLRKRATELIVIHFAPFLNQCFQGIFSFETCFKPYFQSQISHDTFIENYDFSSVGSRLAAATESTA
ncbi:unnamed protein product [Bursaphelenchus xylophilus]|uniref:Conserved oligomeric Golgi complex subunit 8 n=1 Tax=Bursaphelenchus xylophilus TaxID=6326 RepID=A0A1I7S4T9_BURXY|nr:unnamed protein product [Bursaphelenchus xylophilus]CAG9117372.1 unnamed protein product [Bursaphelenchus xylophilus]